MSRRTRTDVELSPLGAQGNAPTSGKRTSAEPDLLETEVHALLDAWRPDERQLFSELMEDAGSALQREMLLRAVAARHTPAELHALADFLRPLPDAAVYDACTVSPDANVPVTSRLRAEADPLFALELNGRALSPRLEDDPGPAYLPPQQGRPRPRFKPPPALLVPPEPPRVGPPPRVAFEEESSTARGRSLRAGRELGASGEELPSYRRAGTAARAPSLINEAVKALGVEYEEQRVDTPELKLERALELAAQALVRGIPVPVTLGRKPGELGRQALMLQVQTAGKGRAFQLHDPFAQETVWANERDLLGRTELPFDAKVWRLITAVALPVRSPAAGSPPRRP